MREMHGVTALLPDRPVPLKQQALLCDKLHLVRPDVEYSLQYREVLERQAAECDFLEGQGLVEFISREYFERALYLETAANQETFRSRLLEVAKDQYENYSDRHKRQSDREKQSNRDEMWRFYSATLSGGFLDSFANIPPRLLFDYCVRMLAAHLGSQLPEEFASKTDIAPLCWFNSTYPDASLERPPESSVETLQIALDFLPVPSESCAWEDILAFKAESRDKLWHYRRFLHSLATKKQTEVEIRDDIEWTLNEYTKAMKIHHLKAGTSFVEVFMLPILETVEDLAKLNWSKVAKGALSVKRRKIELMEAEMKAPGRECAYLFDAQRRFKPESSK